MTREETSSARFGAAGGAVHHPRHTLRAAQPNTPGADPLGPAKAQRARLLHQPTFSDHNAIGCGRESSLMQLNDELIGS